MSLVLYTPKGKLGKPLELPENATIFLGRGDDCHIRLNIEGILPRHVLLEKKGALLTLYSFGAEVKVNDVPVSPNASRVMANDEVISIFHRRFHYFEPTPKAKIATPKGSRAANNENVAPQPLTPSVARSSDAPSTPVKAQNTPRMATPKSRPLSATPRSVTPKDTPSSSSTPKETSTPKEVLSTPKNLVTPKGTPKAFPSTPKEVSMMPTDAAMTPKLSQTPKAISTPNDVTPKKESVIPKLGSSTPMSKDVPPSPAKVTSNIPKGELSAPKIMTPSQSTPKKETPTPKAAPSTSMSKDVLHSPAAKRIISDDSTIMSVPSTPELAPQIFDGPVSPKKSPKITTPKSPKVTPATPQEAPSTPKSATSTPQGLCGTPLRSLLASPKEIVSAFGSPMRITTPKRMDMTPNRKLVFESADVAEVIFSDRKAEEAKEEAKEDVKVEEVKEKVVTLKRKRVQSKTPQVRRQRNMAGIEVSRSRAGIIQSAEKKERVIVPKEKQAEKEEEEEEEKEELKEEVPAAVESAMEIEEKKEEKNEKTEGKKEQEFEEETVDVEKKRPAKRRKRVRSEGSTTVKAQGDTPKRTGILFKGGDALGNPSLTEAQIAKRARNALIKEIDAELAAVKEDAEENMEVKQVQEDVCGIEGHGDVATPAQLPLPSPKAAKITAKLSKSKTPGRDSHDVKRVRMGMPVTPLIHSVVRDVVKEAVADLKAADVEMELEENKIVLSAGDRKLAGSCVTPPVSAIRRGKGGNSTAPRPTKTGSIGHTRTRAELMTAAGVTNLWRHGFPIAIPIQKKKLRKEKRKSIAKVVTEILRNTFSPVPATLPSSSPSPSLSLSLSSTPTPSSSSASPARSPVSSLESVAVTEVHEEALKVEVVDIDFSDEEKEEEKEEQKEEKEDVEMQVTMPICLSEILGAVKEVDVEVAKGDEDVNVVETAGDKEEEKEKEEEEKKEEVRHMYTLDYLNNLSRKELISLCRSHSLPARGSNASFVQSLFALPFSEGSQKEEEVVAGIHSVEEVKVVTESHAVEDVKEMDLLPVPEVAAPVESAKVDDLVMDIAQEAVSLPKYSEDDLRSEKRPHLVRLCQAHSLSFTPRATKAQLITLLLTVMEAPAPSPLAAVTHVVDLPPAPTPAPTLAPAPAPTPAPAALVPAAPRFTRKDLEQMKRAMLFDVCKSLGLSCKGTNAKLVDDICKAIEEGQEKVEEKEEVCVEKEADRRKSRKVTFATEEVEEEKEEVEEKKADKGRRKSVTAQKEAEAPQEPEPKSTQRGRRKSVAATKVVVVEEVKEERDREKEEDMVEEVVPPQRERRKSVAAPKVEEKTKGRGGRRVSVAAKAQVEEPEQVEVKPASGRRKSVAVPATTPAPTPVPARGRGRKSIVHIAAAENHEEEEKEEVVTSSRKRGRQSSVAPPAEPARKSVRRR